MFIKGGEETEGNLVTFEFPHSFAPWDVTHVTVHPTVKEIEKYAFYKCKQLKSIVIPEGNASNYQPPQKKTKDLHCFIPEGVEHIGEDDATLKK
eukprot:14153544-Ditylum_brightwellii.AAC.1